MNNEYPSIWLVLYRTFWLLVVVGAIIAACAWADKDMHGVPPEHQPEAASTQSAQ